MKFRDKPEVGAKFARISQMNWIKQDIGSAESENVFPIIFDLWFLLMSVWIYK